MCHVISVLCEANGGQYPGHGLGGWLDQPEPLTVSAMSNPTLAAQAESGIQSEGSHPEADPSMLGAAEAVSQEKSCERGDGVGDAQERQG